MATLTIAAFARQAGVGVETVRYYQRIGLMSVPRREAGPRLYDEAALRRLRFIRSAQNAGFPLVEIAELLALDATEDRERARQMARRRILALDERIAALQASRDALQGLADRCGRGDVGPCPILEAFEAG